ncbi:hypothetical protein R1sor_019459 [Riccia sorocarpa]|uniref:DDE Tnp4 domain-containing protein n=1 Tax=Riccia sorocarpa TaxID=122646 RepID=A0ABD3IFA3_9MARC
MVNYTNRVMTALESAMGYEIAWPDCQERAVNSAHFAGLGFPGCIGLVDGTLVKLSQRPRDDGETYFDRKSYYSMNVHVICDQNKHVIYFFAGMPGSCHDLTCLRRSSLWGRLGSAQLFDNSQYLLGDSGYIPLDRLVCSYKRTGDDMDKVDFNTCIAHARVGNEHCIGILKARWHSLKEIRTQLRNLAENAYVIRWMRCCIILHNFLIWRRHEWLEDDHPMEVEREDDLRPPPQGARECNRRGLERRQAIQRTCLEINRRPGGAEAPLHFELYTEKDDVNYIRWKWISKKEAHRVLRGIDGRLLRRSGLHDALWMDWARPEEGMTSVREFVLSWDDRPLSSTVGGREIPLTIDTMRETVKTWYANDVFLPVWRPIIQLINVVLLGKQKPLEVTWAFLYILKNTVGPADEDENLDWATYFKEKVSEEIRACKKQMQASGKRKVRPTCIGIVVLHILRTCGIVDDEKIVLSDSDKFVEEVTPPHSARAAPVQVLSSSTSPDRVHDPSSNSPECVHVSSPSNPERVLASSSSSPDRGHLSPDPRDISSTSSPSSTRHASPTSPNRQHSPESSPRGRIVLLVTTPLAVGHQAARTARNRMIMNLWLGLDRPWCRIRLMMTTKKGPLKGPLQALRPCMHQTSQR